MDNLSTCSFSPPSIADRVTCRPAFLGTLFTVGALAMPTGTRTVFPGPAVGRTSKPSHEAPEGDAGPDTWIVSNPAAEVLVSATTAAPGDFTVRAGQVVLKGFRLK